MSSLLPLLSLAQSAAALHHVVQWAIDVSLVLIVAGMVACLYRIVTGPHLADRALGADTLAVHLIALILLLTMRQGIKWFTDGMLILSLLSFAGTVAMAQFIARTQSGAAIKTEASRT